MMSVRSWVMSTRKKLHQPCFSSQSQCGLQASRLNARCSTAGNAHHANHCCALHPSSVCITCASQPGALCSYLPVDRAVGECPKQALPVDREVDECAAYAVQQLQVRVLKERQHYFQHGGLLSVKGVAIGRWEGLGRSRSASDTPPARWTVERKEIGWRRGQ